MRIRVVICIPKIILDQVLGLQELLLEGYKHVLTLVKLLLDESIFGLDVVD